MTQFAVSQSSGASHNHRWRSLQAPLLLAAAYYAGTQVAFYIGTLSDKVFAPFWPPNTILLCALLLTPPAQWWKYILAILPAHVVAEIGIGMSVGQLAIAFVTNVAIAVISALILRALVIGRPLATLRSTGLFVLVAGLAVPAVVAAAGAFVPISGGASIERYWEFCAEWFASNALGNLTLGPPILIGLSRGKGIFLNHNKARLAEAALLFLLLIAVCIVAFSYRPSTSAAGFLPSLIYLPVPFIIIAALRFGNKGASFAVLAVTVVLIWRSLSASSPFASDDVETSVFALQTFLIGLAAPMQMLGASIEETRSAARTVRETEERMAFAAESAHTGLWEYNVEAERFWTTEFCNTLFGLPASGATSRDALLSAVHPEDRAIATAAIDTDLVPGSPTISEFRIVLENGTVRWIQSSAHIYHNEHNLPVRIGGIFSDVTQRKEDQIEAEERRRDILHLTRVSILGELSGAIAHEINQPLTAILSNAQAVRLMLARPSPDLVAANEAVDDIIKEDTRASEVISRLRGLLKKGEMKFESVKVNTLIGEVIELLHSEMISRRVRIHAKLAENIPTVRADKVQLQQVILNLIMNAIEAMAATDAHRRIITIRTSRAGAGTAEITIADHGNGIAPEHHSRVGEPFFTTKQHGLGLGLSLCSTIIRSHGGEFAILNNDGGGAIATISLPPEPSPIDTL